MRATVSDVSYATEPAFGALKAQQGNVQEAPGLASTLPVLMKAWMHMASAGLAKCQGHAQELLSRRACHEQSHQHAPSTTAATRGQCTEQKPGADCQLARIAIANERGLV